MNAFSRSWELTKLSFEVMKKDKELLAFPILGGVFSLLFIIAIILPTIISSSAGKAIGGPLGSAMFYTTVLCVYLGLAFIATFFNVCVVYTTKTRFEGKNATFGDSIKFAFSRIHLIFLWSLVSATVGLILRIIDDAAERAGVLGKIILNIITSILGAAWSLLTVFVVPGMVYHNLGPFAAIKKSAETFKKTWGENLIREVGLGFAAFAVFALGAIVGIVLIFLTLYVHVALTILVVICMVIYFIIVGAFFSVAGSIFNTALFVYADTGKIPSAFGSEMIKGAFKRKE